jgi:hypothetical protein
VVHALHIVIAMRSTLALIVTLATLVPACLKCGLPPEDSDDLDTARTQFAAADRPSYSFTWQEGCFCGSDQIRPIRISVTGDTITRATFADDHTPVTDAVMTGLKTIPGVFDMIEGAITAHDHSLRVTYDPDVEYPIEVFIDPSGASDDGMQLTLSSFASPADAS